MPSIEQDDIDSFLFKYISKLFKEMGIPETREQELGDFYSRYYIYTRNLFKTLRDAKRYLNGLRATLLLVKTEIFLSDFFALEVIRLFYPEAYEDIWRYPWFYIPMRWSERTYLSSPFNIEESILGGDITSNPKYILGKKNIENLINKAKEKGEILKTLFEEIFFVEIPTTLGGGRVSYNDETIAQYRADKRITHPDCFEKYFMLKVPRGMISDEFLETTLES